MVRIAGICVLLLTGCMNCFLFDWLLVCNLFVLDCVSLCVCVCLCVCLFVCLSVSGKPFNPLDDGVAALLKAIADCLGE